MGKTLDAIRRIGEALTKGGYSADIDVDRDGMFYKARFDWRGGYIVIDHVNFDDLKGETVSLTSKLPEKRWLEKETAYEEHVTAHNKNIKDVREILRRYRINVVRF